MIDVEGEAEIEADGDDEAVAEALVEKLDETEVEGVLEKDGITDTDGVAVITGHEKLIPLFGFPKLFFLFATHTKSDGWQPVPVSCKDCLAPVLSDSETPTTLLLSPRPRPFLAVMLCPIEMKSIANVVELESAIPLPGSFRIPLIRLKLNPQPCS